MSTAQQQQTTETAAGPRRACSPVQNSASLKWPIVFAFCTAPSTIFVGHALEAFLMRHYWRQERIGRSNLPRRLQPDNRRWRSLTELQEDPDALVVLVASALIPGKTLLWRRPCSFLKAPRDLLTHTKGKTNTVSSKGLLHNHLGAVT
jgi:hypothetical protein